MDKVANSPLATVGILSIGDMGMGVAQLLLAHNFRVVTNLEGRRFVDFYRSGLGPEGRGAFHAAASVMGGLGQDTASRVSRTSIDVVPSDSSLVLESDYILSIVPPRDALSIAQRITKACAAISSKPTPVFYLDLNAISPRTAKEIAALITSTQGLKFIDGGIIGGAPKLRDSKASLTSGLSSDCLSLLDGSVEAEWSRPSIPLSGPEALADCPVAGAQLAHILNTKHVSPEIGSASGLKCCFASLSKGLTALALQSFSTASSLGVLDELKEQLGEQKFQGMERGVCGVPPKAYRWVAEMEEIGKCFGDQGWAGGVDGKEGVFGKIADLYRVIADETILGQEKTESRKRGKTAADVSDCIIEGLQRKKRKTD